MTFFHLYTLSSCSYCAFLLLLLYVFNRHSKASEPDSPFFYFYFFSFLSLSLDGHNKTLTVYRSRLRNDPRIKSKRTPSNRGGGGTIIFSPAHIIFYRGYKEINGFNIPCHNKSRFFFYIFLLVFRLAIYWGMPKMGSKVVLIFFSYNPHLL